jgi:hypothetical protein
MKRTGKRGRDSCIDAFRSTAFGHGAADAVLDKAKAAAFLATDRVHVTSLARELPAGIADADKMAMHRLLQEAFRPRTFFNR